jgi:hypothetical protein
MFTPGPGTYAHAELMGTGPAPGISLPVEGPPPSSVFAPGPGK